MKFFDAIKKNPFQFFALVCFFIIFPATSWYYLKNGFNYQLSIIEEVQVKDSLQRKQISGGNLDLEQKLKSRVIALCFQENATNAIDYIKRAEIIQDQFADRKDLFFLTILPESVYNTVENALSPKPDSAHFLMLNRADTTLDWSSYYQIQSDQNANLVLLDTGLYVRNYYLAEDTLALGKMVEHLIKVLPYIPSADIEFQPDLEK